MSLLDDLFYNSGDLDVGLQQWCRKKKLSSSHSERLKDRGFMI